MTPEQDARLVDERNLLTRRVSYSPRTHDSMLKRTSVATFGIWLVAVSYFGFCVADMLLSIQNERSQVIKIGSFGLLGLAVILRPRFHKLVLLIVPLVAIFVTSLSRSFNFYAGADELLRFLFPLAITIALYAYRDKLEFLVSVFFIMVATNNIFQCYFYFAYMVGLPLVVPVRFDSGLYLRAQGWIGFFSEFGFMNFCALMLYSMRASAVKGGFKKACFTLFALLSFSFKMMVVLAVYPLAVGRNRGRAYLLLLTGGLFVGGAVAFGLFGKFTGLAASKISFYIVAGNSARAESYRVMWQSLLGGNYLGEGLGSFGGPASVKYNSPLYSHYRFNWYGMQEILKTTDTFYPHLFVELGFVGGSMWLCLVILYGQRHVWNRAWIFMVSAFLFDNVFSMAILSPSYGFPAFLVMYCLSHGGNDRYPG